MRAVLLSAFFVASAVPAHAGPDGMTAEAAVAVYSQAMRSADCDRLSALMPALLIERHPTAPAMYCQSAQNWQRAGMTERLRAPTHRITSGSHRLVVIPHTRMLVQHNGQPSLMDGVYVVFSSDGGQRWQVLDMVCDHLAKWVQAVFPPYDGKIEFGASRMHLLTTS